MIHVTTSQRHSTVNNTAYLQPFTPLSFIKSFDYKQKKHCWKTCVQIYKIITVVNSSSHSDALQWYFSWYSWCHLLKSMLNTIRQPVANPAIRHLQQQPQASTPRHIRHSQVTTAAFSQTVKLDSCSRDAYVLEFWPIRSKPSLKFTSIINFP